MKMAAIRNPFVAGQFYPGTSQALAKMIESMTDKTVKQEDAIGALSPHAGYIYSGPVAGSVFASMKPRKNYVIIGPNHTGMGEAFGLSTSSSWKTPLGDVPVNKELADRIKENSKYIKSDDLSHEAEHSIEVQLPFLQSVAKNFSFVPISVSYAGLDAYESVGRDIAKAVKDLKMAKDVAVIASSDMTHYESQASAKKKDSVAIESILKLDESELFKNITKYDITMCGFAPAIIMIVAAKELGARSAKLVKYQTSGDVSGDFSSVVGYAGIIII